MKQLVLSLLLAALLPAAAKTIYVSACGPEDGYFYDDDVGQWYYSDDARIYIDGEPGDSWDNAYSKWSDAIDAASDGDVLLVGPGSYHERHGGVYYSGPEIEIRSVEGPANTFLEGNLLYDNIKVFDVTFQDYVSIGGGTFFNCIFKDDRSVEGKTRQSPYSGAIVLYWGNTSPISGATLHNCIVENITGDGGALEDCILFNCIVRNNRGLYAGAMYDCTAYNTLIVGNHAVRAEPDWVNRYDGWGGAATGSTLVNCTVVGNVADAGCGGVRNCKVMNSIVVGNRLANGSGSNWSKTSSFYASCTTGSPNGSGNISQAPKFADSDYRLAAGSPGINAGNNSYVYGTEDLDGFQRIYGSRVDMGAYEYVGRKTCTVYFDPNDGSVSIDSISVVVGTVLGSLPIPYRYGWRFEGWYDDPDGGALVTAQTAASGRNMYLYAHWTEETDSVWQPVYRFYSKGYKGHFYTIDPEERATLMCTNPNWKYEGIAYYAATEEVEGTVPLHRFYSKNYRGHFFTVDEDEMWNIRHTNPNWKYEGVAFYVYPNRTADATRSCTAIYRFWSKAYRHHFYTIDEAEKDTLIATNPNWKYETIAFWAIPAEGDNAQYAMRNARATTLDAEGEMPDAETDARGFALETEGGKRLATPGVTEVGGALVETRGEAPEAAEIESRAEGTESESHAESAEFAESSFCAERPEAIPLHLALPAGVWSASLWSAADGVVAEEPAEGAFDFELPADGAWHWLRVRDEEEEESFSLWLRTE